MKLNDEIRKNDPFRVPDGYFETLVTVQWQQSGRRKPGGSTVTMIQ
jgi:hypothetical protein